MENNEEQFCIIDWDLWHSTRKETKIKTTYDFDKYFLDSKRAKEIALKTIQELNLYTSEIERCANQGKFSANFVELDQKIITLLELLGYELEWVNDNDGNYWLVKW